MSKIYVDLSDGRGRGVFTRHSVKAGDLLDVNFSVDIDGSYRKYVDETPLKDYYFEFPDGTIKLVLGNISLINHSKVPNIKKEWKYVEGLGHMILIYALLDLDENIELFHNYEFDNDKSPAWINT